MKVLVPAGWQPEEALAEDAGLAELSAQLRVKCGRGKTIFEKPPRPKG